MLLISVRRVLPSAALSELALLAASGCAPPPQPIFPELHPPIVWPPAPDRPRIQYIGELTGQASLKAARGGWDALAAIIVGPPQEMAFATPLAVAVAGERVYVADPSAPGGPAVHVLDLATRQYDAIRTAGGQPLQWPIDVSVSSITSGEGPRVAIVDAKRAAVFLFSISGRELATLGADLLQRPAAVAWHPQRDAVLVLDAAAHEIVQIGAAGREELRYGGRGAEPGRMNFPAGLAVAPALRTYLPPGGASTTQPDRAPWTPGPFLLVADAMNFRVKIDHLDGATQRAFGRKGDAAGDFALPRDVAADSAGHIYVLDNQFENVQVFDASGRLLMAWGGEGRGPGQFYLPSGITIDAQDRIWIADTYNRRVQAFRYLPEASRWE